MAGRPTSEDSKKIGARMRQILKQKNITQEQAYLRLGLGSQAALFHYLSGRSEIPLNVINKFCMIFNVPVATLFSTDSTIINADNDLILDIMLAIDEFLAENKVAMDGEQRKNLAKHFLAKGCNNVQVIKSALSAVLAVNLGMPSKKGK